MVTIIRPSVYDTCEHMLRVSVATRAQKKQKRVSHDDFWLYTDTLTSSSCFLVLQLLHYMKFHGHNSINTDNAERGTAGRAGARND